jgi:hypothetical protein
MAKTGVYAKNGCFGVDLNRNFDIKWMCKFSIFGELRREFFIFNLASGSSSNPCSEVYAGTHGGSEYEVDRLKRYLNSKISKWVVYFGLHSYGGYWLTPFSYSLNHIVENFNSSVIYSSMI